MILLDAGVACTDAKGICISSDSAAPQVSLLMQAKSSVLEESCRAKPAYEIPLVFGAYVAGKC